MTNETDLPILTSLIAGGTAGITVDVTLFPLDTLKTRLQSPCGFFASGGFQHLYKGVGTAAVGSVPSASVFFCTYDTIKKIFSKQVDPVYLPVIHMGAACAGEIGSCLVKVPIEVVKQRQQAALEKLSPLLICKRAIETEGYLGLYRGFVTTTLREIPFVLIQFPIWEWFKAQWYCAKKENLSIIEVAACGSVSGGIAAAVTTPLDVAKTRIMLAEKNIHSHVDCWRLRTSTMLINIYREQGVQGSSLI
ncbi:S-adenosylmethionine mitochondrial carrier protein homolog isoform X2 [Cryptotermes secundus]|uniref:S-adenosylmethionine mitochondrial carrier protein homolog isoform X2 n=1 Tax=Cryptotermes secundus TaxID=105785 RepID=UPI000CD7CDAD|nr:S-adenosylmethionine mitochondrial carrier protein homolog isoform X2 [Cryptotermes secundus]